MWHEVYRNYLTREMFDIEIASAEQKGMFELARSLFFESNVDWLLFHSEFFRPTSPLFQRYAPPYLPRTIAADPMYRAILDMFVMLGVSRGPLTLSECGAPLFSCSEAPAGIGER
jgi:hypothetical protein